MVCGSETQFKKARSGGMKEVKSLDNEAIIQKIRDRFVSVFFPPQSDPVSGLSRAVLLREDWAARFERHQGIVKEITDSGKAFTQTAIVVGGTSGKGSTSLLLAHMLAASGSRVGVFNSPHLMSFTERFVVLNGQRAQMDTFWDFLDVQTTWLAEKYPRLSYFEALFVLAGLWFTHCGCESVVWEAGCGGRWDAVNALVRKKLVILTNIELDHQELLGDTREKIAGEKAPLVSRSEACILGERDPSILAILEAEQRRWNSKKIDLQGYSDVQVSLGVDQRVSLYHQGEHPCHTQLYGEGQVQNIRHAMAAAHYLGVSLDHVKGALNQRSLPGRIELIAHSPRIVLDVAHNPHKLTALVDVVRSWPARKRWAVFAFSERKDVQAMLMVAAHTFDHIWVTEFSQNQGRSCKPLSEIKQIVDKIKQSDRVSCVQNPAVAIAEAKSSMKSEDVGVVSGSLFLYAQAYACLSSVI